MHRFKFGKVGLAFAVSLVVIAGCSKSKHISATPPVIKHQPSPANATGISYWLTTGDKVNLLSKQTTSLNLGVVANALPTVNVDSTQQFQTINGFGYTLTQGSAEVINQLPTPDRSLLLTELFGNSDNSIGVSFLRIGIGATDLASSVYSYDDMPPGQTDISLNNFSLAMDQVAMIPVLKQILQINPKIKLLATPWSAPVWMKDNNSTIGGRLSPAYYKVYADYFVKYIRVMQANGLDIFAISPQNEPLNPNNNPSLVMTAPEQSSFIKNNLGPAFITAGINTKIIIYDHNCDRTDYPLDVMSDPVTRQYVDGSAFHLYAGDISALSQVHFTWPDKNIYFTEQYTGSGGSFAGDFQWHIKNVIIGSLRNYSKVALEWNLANNAAFGPHTQGGCTTCLGALTVSEGITRNVGYYIVAQVSKFVPPGSVRIASDNVGSLETVAFLKGNGGKVLVVLNDSNSPQNFNIKFNGKWLSTSLPGSSAGTYVW